MIDHLFAKELAPASAEDSLAQNIIGFLDQLAQGSADARAKVPIAIVELSIALNVERKKALKNVIRIVRSKKDSEAASPDKSPATRLVHVLANCATKPKRA